MSHAEEEKEERTIAGHTVKVNTYDVGSQVASLHYPLPRLLAGLLQFLPKFELNWNNQEFGNRAGLEDYIEHPLRVKVLQAQVSAGMWRRNGLSLMKQLMYYTNVRCRSEMHDRDVYIVQFAAAEMPPNDFLITLLSKYNLHQWARSKDENLVPTVSINRKS
jgi:hypothetical protein